MKSQDNTTNRVNVDGNITRNPYDIGSGFCSFFTNIVDWIIPDNANCNLRTAFKQDRTAQQPNTHRFCLNPVTVNFINRQIRLLKTNKAIGLDGISARLLKDAGPIISAPLTEMINLSITTATVPDEWKYARVVCIHKDGVKTATDN